MNELQKNVAAVVFDFGGVLIDWNPHYLYLKRFGGNRIAVDAFLQEIGFVEWNTRQDAGYPFGQAVLDMTARYPHYADHFRAYDENWIEMVGGPIEGSVQILRELKARELPLYALSNWSNEKFCVIRSDLDFLDCFDFILLSGEVRLVKPDPKIFQLLLERIGRPAEECLFIDDSPHNIEAAARLGFQTLRFTGAEDMRLELSRLGLLDGSAPS